MRLECQSPQCLSNRHPESFEKLFNVKMTVTCGENFNPDVARIEGDLALRGWNEFTFECHYCGTQHVHQEEDEDGTAQTATS